MNETELIGQLATAIHNEAVGWFIFAVFLAIGAIIAGTAIYRVDDEEAKAAGVVVTVIGTAIAVIMFACHWSNYMEPSYEASKQLHNRKVQAELWP